LGAISQVGGKGCGAFGGDIITFTPTMIFFSFLVLVRNSFLNPKTPFTYSKFPSCNRMDFHFQFSQIELFV
jgi:hypothetical protein